jgi:hypothetical protein
MPETVGRIVDTPGKPEPFEVVFSVGPRVIATHPVGTRRAAEALIERLLPTLQGIENDNV